MADDDAVDDELDDAPKTPQEILSHLQWWLSEFARRFRFLNTYQVQLERATGGARFDVFNTSLWVSMNGSYKALMIDVASFFRSAYSRGGFFGALQAGNFGPLKVGPTKTAADDVFGRMNVEGRRRAFSELFPKAAAANRWAVNSCDISELKAAFIKRVEPLVAERDKLWAHPFENDKTGVAVLGWGEHGATVIYAQGVLNNLRRLVFDQTSNFNDPTPEEVEEARGIVDLLLWGDMQQLLLHVAPEPTRYFRDKRESVYARLREEHAKCGGVFNARQLAGRIEDAAKPNRPT